MNIETLHSHFLKSSGICTDTRKITPNCIFFALKGANFNGNTFAQKALEKGALLAVIDEKEHLQESDSVLVNDVLTTLQQLANFHRNYLKLPIIALTGSNGKTTTKELINAVLSKKFSTSATLGNLNNHIGVPLTLLSMNENTEIGIVEMGANHLKEIETLCNIAEPNFGYITNFGKAHIEGFGSEAGVVKGKSELYDHLKNNNGLVFLNRNDTKQLEQLRNYKNTYSFSTSTDSDLEIQMISCDPFVKIRFSGLEIQSQLIGSYNFNNIAAAIAIGTYFKLTKEQVKEAIETYVPTNNRSQIIKKGSNTIILDAYNANPSSMQAALDNFAGIASDKKIAFLGDMFELGDTADKEHQHIANHAAALSINSIHIIGGNFAKVAKVSENTHKHSSFEAFSNIFNPKEIQDCHILIKGSRGMALERILDLL